VTKWFLVVLSSLVVLVTPTVAGQLVQPRGESSSKSAQESIQGVWQPVEVRLTGPGARTITIPEPRRTLTIFTARHYSRVVDEAERPRPVLADPATATADDLRSSWGPFVAEAGTYELNELNGGHSITMRPIVAKNPAAMAPGTFITCSYRLEGNTLWVVEQRNQRGPLANPVTIKLVRVE